MFTELFVVLYNVGCGFTVDQEKCLSLEQCLTHLGRLSKCIVNEGKGISGAQTTRACDLNDHGVNTVDEYHRTHYLGVPIRTYTYIFIILIITKYSIGGRYANDFRPLYYPQIYRYII